MKMVLVEFWDSGFMEGGWHEREDIKSLSFCLTTSIGVLMCETKDYYTLVPNLSHDEVAKAISIPRSAVKRIGQLKVTS